MTTGCVCEVQKAGPFGTWRLLKNNEAPLSGSRGPAARKRAGLSHKQATIHVCLSSDLYATFQTPRASPRQFPKSWLPWMSKRMGGPALPSRLAIQISCVRSSVCGPGNRNETPTEQTVASGVINNERFHFLTRLRAWAY